MCSFFSLAYVDIYIAVCLRARANLCVDTPQQQMCRDVCKTWCVRHERCLLGDRNVELALSFAAQPAVAHGSVTHVYRRMYRDMYANMCGHVHGQTRA